jgi:hypothetical protein
LCLFSKIYLFSSLSRYYSHSSAHALVLNLNLCEIATLTHDYNKVLGNGHPTLVCVCIFASYFGDVVCILWNNISRAMLNISSTNCICSCTKIWGRKMHRIANGDQFYFFKCFLVVRNVENNFFYNFYLNGRKLI